MHTCCGPSPSPSKQAYIRYLCTSPTVYMSSMPPPHFAADMPDRPAPPSLHSPFPSQVYMDTVPSQNITQTDGMWALGNRYIAAAREVLQHMVELDGWRINTLRAYHFIIANGPWVVFQGYMESLDYLMLFAWQDLEKLKTGGRAAGAAGAGRGEGGGGTWVRRHAAGGAVRHGAGRSCHDADV